MKQGKHGDVPCSSFLISRSLCVKRKRRVRPYVLAGPAGTRSELNQC